MGRPISLQIVRGDATESEACVKEERGGWRGWRCETLVMDKGTEDTVYVEIDYGLNIISC